MKKILKISLGILILLIFGGTIVYLYSKSKEEPTTFETQKPFYTDIIKKSVANGSVVPRKEIEIKPQVSGIIHKLYVEPGDEVQEGDMIAKVKVVPNMVSLNNARTRVNKAEINLKEAKREFKRQKKLFDKGYIPEAEFEKVEIQYENAREEVEAAKNNLALIEKGALDKSDKSSNTNVRATISGMVLNVPVEQGNSVIEANNFNDGTTIASVADMNDMIFKGKVDESEVGQLNTGMDMLLKIGAIQNKDFDATLEYIAPKGVEENGAIQFEVKARVNLEQDEFLRAGYSANANIILEKRDSVLAIPESVLQFKGDTTYVEVKVEGNVFEERRPEFGISDGINIQVKSGLNEDAKIKDPTRKAKE